MCLQNRPFLKRLVGLHQEGSQPSCICKVHTVLQRVLDFDREVYPCWSSSAPGMNELPA